MKKQYKFLSKYKLSLSQIICGILIVIQFFGEQIKIFGLPLYGYLAILTSFIYIVENGRITLCKIRLFLLLWIFIGTILWVLTLSKVGNSPYFYFIASVGVMFVVSINITDQSSLKYFFVCYVLGLLLTCIFSTFEYLYGLHFVKFVYDSDYYLRMGQKNMFGFQVNINDNATLIAVSLLSIVIFIRKRPILCFGLAIWAITILHLIGSRLAIFALYLTSICALIIFVYKRMFSGKNVVPKILFFFASIFLIIILIYYSDNLLIQFSDPVNFYSDQARINFIKNAMLETFHWSAFLGNGAGVTQVLIGNHSIHAFLIEVLCDYGIVIFVLLLYFLFTMLFAFAEKNIFSGEIFISCFAIMFLVISFGSSSMLRIRPVMTLFLLMWFYYKFRKRDFVN